MHTTHDMKVRGHNLLWGMANPEWLGNKPASSYTKFSGRQLEEILVNHIRSVMGHYRDKFPGVIKLVGRDKTRLWDGTIEFNSDGIEWTNIGTNPDRATTCASLFKRLARLTRLLSCA